MRNRGSRRSGPRRRSALDGGCRRRENSPALSGAAEITAFLSSLAVQGNVAASTQNQALSASLFLYLDVLEQDVPWLGEVVRAKRPSGFPSSSRAARSDPSSAVSPAPLA
jgi:hypothetical protein